MAGDNTLQRQNVANSAVVAVTQLADALYTLEQLRDQKSKFVSAFNDTDFPSTPTQPGVPSNPQLTAGMLNVFFDNVLPAFLAVYQDSGPWAGTGNQAYTPDSANQGRNEQIILQMRKG